MLTRSPADCFVALWREAELQLARATIYDENFVPPRSDWVPPGIVSYGTRRAGRLGDGDYRWCDGSPSITLVRPLDRIPKRADLPDPQTQPDEDACLLAHEFGHFHVDPQGDAALAAIERVRTGSGTLDDGLLVLKDEEAAWKVGAELLADQGCSQWEHFIVVRARSLTTYEAALPGRPRAAPWEPPPR